MARRSHAVQLYEASSSACSRMEALTKTQAENRTKVWLSHERYYLTDAICALAKHLTGALHRTLWRLLDQNMCFFALTIGRAFLLPQKASWHITSAVCRPPSSARYNCALSKERWCGLFTVSSNTCAAKISVKFCNDVFCHNRDKSNRFSVSTEGCRFSPSASQICRSCW